MHLKTCHNSAALAVVVSALLWLGRFPSIAQPTTGSATNSCPESVTNAAVLSPAPPTNQPPAIPPAAAPAKGLMIVIDDVGSNEKLLREFLGTGLPLSYAVIPGLQYSETSMRLVKEQGRTLLLHVPMEPFEARNMTSPRAFVRTSMPRAETEHFMETLLASAPLIDGINNHMGSKATADSRTMDAVMASLDRHNTHASHPLFFLDSHTATNTIGYRSALGHHLPAALNNGFIDDSKNPDIILKQLVRFSHEASSNRHPMVVIGHCRKETLQAIHRFQVLSGAARQACLPLATLFPNTLPPGTNVVLVASIAQCASNPPVARLP
jgi:polysaccharide deacetylase 2 family uncharacterized protein YibQ